jgi:predicted site-specific integrase-resolvase
MTEDHIGVIETATILGIATSVVYYHLANGNLKPVGKFGKSYILSRTAVEEFKRQRGSQR